MNDTTGCGYQGIHIPLYQNIIYTTLPTKLQCAMIAFWLSWRIVYDL